MNKYTPQAAIKLYPYQKVAAQDKATPEKQTVVVVGGGPVGLALALDLGLKDTPVLLLDDQDGAGEGSRAICFSKRTLEIADRLGFGDALVEKGVVWNVGRVFHRDSEIFNFNLLEETGHKYPAFINLQQPYFEKFLVDQIRMAQSKGAPIEIRGCNEVTGLYLKEDHTVIDIDTPDGQYQIGADWLIACDGAKSAVRKMMGLSFDGRLFEDNFLIADVKMTADFPTERWFWFEPPFIGSGQSALLHKQPDNIWRIDFQLGWDIDRIAELDPKKIRSRIDAMLGSNVQYDLEWTSIYTFQCRKLGKFRHGRILFAGDAAHQVSPFGARGANSGIQDIDNLAWKLDLVIKGKAPDRLLDTYCEERVYAAGENILNSTRSTDFITPKSDISTCFRDAVLDLAKHHSFARPLVNSGRLSVPCVYDGLSLNGSDALNGPHNLRVGAPCIDAPTPDGYLLQKLSGEFALLTINCDAPDKVEYDGITIRRIAVSTSDNKFYELAKRYLGNCRSAVYLIRPDQYIAGRWNEFNAHEVQNALSCATAKD